MVEFGQDVFTVMRAAYADMTNVERAIADYLLNERPREALTLQAVTRRTFVSEASLSRFAQRCGFKGFREFAYQYAADSESLEVADRFSPATEDVLDGYRALFARTLRLIDEVGIGRAVEMIRSSRMIHVYGEGLSGYAAREFKTRFMRLGLTVEAFTDDFMMKTNAALIQPGTLAIGMSVSGKTRNTMGSLRTARNNGASTLLLTGSTSKSLRRQFDETLTVATYQDLSTGLNTSPQFPLVIMIDLIFAHYLHTNLDKNIETYHATERALNENSEK